MVNKLIGGISAGVPVVDLVCKYANLDDSLLSLFNFSVLLSLPVTCTCSIFKLVPFHGRQAIIMADILKFQL